MLSIVLLRKSEPTVPRITTSNRSQNTSSYFLINRNTYNFAREADKTTRAASVVNLRWAAAATTERKSRYIYQDKRTD